MGQTRNQLYRKVPWVRIPPSPPSFGKGVNMWDYIIGGVIVILLGLALRAFLKEETGGCAHCPYSKNCKHKDNK